MDFEGTVAVITGGGSGIGRATALSFARRGARIVIADINAERIDAVVGEIGGHAIGVQCDVTSFTDLEATRDRAIDSFGRIDLVMNNVGVIAMGAVEDIPIEGWQRVIDVNLLGIVRSNLAFLPWLIEQSSGYIINTASTAGLLPYGFDRLPYTATKHAIVGLSEALAVYLAPKGIAVSCLCPAGVMTNMGENIKVYGGQLPLRTPNLRVLEAEEVGEIVADAVAEERFLIVTDNDIKDELRERAADIDAYVARLRAEEVAR
jgi:NAD(P)-dependent dehydrogenase (short-subunit alcohol dehydrogenase family)